MKNLSVILKNKPGALADMGEILGKAGVSLEGGGVFVYQDQGLAHFLVENAEKAKNVLEENGITVAGIQPVLIQKLKQEVPGQLGKICRILEKNDINILVQYSDHANQLILVVDDYEKGRQISKDWAQGRYD